MTKPNPQGGGHRPLVYILARDVRMCAWAGHTYAGAGDVLRSCASTALFADLELTARPQHAADSFCQ